MKRMKCNKVFTLFLILSLNITHSANIALAYGEVNINTEFSTEDATIGLEAYQNWLPDWQAAGSTDSGKVLLTPGSSDADLNFAWYSETEGTPAVMISTNKLYTQADIFKGTATSINRSNGSITYASACHVSISGYFSADTTYYYRYTSDILAPAVEWSKTYTYKNRNSSSFSAILAGDAQIGASDNIAADTYSWNQTLKQALKTAPEASFLLSAGDQIDYKTNTGDNGLRESQYAGFLYPPALRSLPVAAAIGNHETKGSDYQYHFNNPNDDEQFGSTPSGCDYYFRRGSALFIVLNSNNRNTASHRKLMKQAVAENETAKWRIVLFHHDIYGSGAMHSNRTSSNIRILLAPLMDEFRIDLVFSGHDHSYSRSYAILDGTAIDYGSNTLHNPVGTTYISLGSSSGSKMYGLAPKKQYYVTERSNNPLPTYSILNISSHALNLQTYDYTGKKYADDFRITKTSAKINPMVKIKKASAKKKTSYTKASYKKLNRALTKINSLIKPTPVDKGAGKVAKYYKKSKDPLSYYGYAAGTNTSLPAGFSTLLDKTRLRCIKIKSTQLDLAYQKLKKAVSGLQKTSLTVKRGKKKCKNNTVIKLKKGKKLRLKIRKTPARYKVTYHSAAKKYVTVSKKGIIRAKRKRKKTVPVTIKFQNRRLRLKIRII